MCFCQLLELLQSAFVIICAIHYVAPPRLQVQNDVVKSAHRVRDEYLAKLRDVRRARESKGMGTDWLFSFPIKLVFSWLLCSDKA